MNQLSTSILYLVLKRLAIAMPILLLISIISFALINAAPGDALAELKQDPRISQETVNRLREQYGLDRPLLVRYGAWLSGVVQGDFGHRPIRWRRWLFVVLLALPVLGEVPTALQLSGVTLVTLGMVFAFWRHAGSRKPITG